MDLKEIFQEIEALAKFPLKYTDNEPFDMNLYDLKNFNPLYQMTKKENFL